MLFGDFCLSPISHSRNKGLSDTLWVFWIGTEGTGFALQQEAWFVAENLSPMDGVCKYKTCISNIKNIWFSIKLDTTTILSFQWTAIIYSSVISEDTWDLHSQCVHCPFAKGLIR